MPERGAIAAKWVRYFVGDTYNFYGRRRTGFLRSEGHFVGQTADWEGKQGGAFFRMKNRSGLRGKRGNGEQRGGACKTIDRTAYRRNKADNPNAIRGCFWLVPNAT